MTAFIVRHWSEGNGRAKTAVDAVFACKGRFLQRCRHYLDDPPSIGLEPMAPGQVENQPGTTRERLFAPRVRVKRMAELNDWLLDQCIARATIQPDPEIPGKTVREVVEAPAVGRPLEVRAHADRIKLRPGKPSCAIGSSTMATATDKSQTAIAIAIAIARACIRRGAQGRFFNVVDLVSKPEAETRAGGQGRIADHLTRLDFPRRENGPLDAFLILLAPSDQPPPRAHRGDRHHQPHPWRMAGRLRRREDDHRPARPAHPPQPHPRDRQRQLSLQGQLRDSEKETEGDSGIDPIMSQ